MKVYDLETECSMCKIASVIQKYVLLPYDNRWVAVTLLHTM